MPVKQEFVRKGGIPVKIFTDDVDHKSIEQLAAVSELPIVRGHIAAMPDVHLGIGATIGSVIPTRKAIIPSAAGVDLGCLRGNTSIPLLDGTKRSLESLVGKGEFWVYSVDHETLKIAPGKAIALKTRSEAEMVKVIISGGDEIFCTPDHPFMLIDGTYCNAEDLERLVSLMPLYRHWDTKDGYERSSNGRNLRLTHRIVYEATQGPLVSGYAIHHINHDQFDNRPDNLGRLSYKEHSRLHQEISGRTFPNNDPEFQRRRLSGIRKRLADPEVLAQMREVGTRNILTYMSERPEHFKESVAGNGAQYLRHYNSTPLPCPACGELQKNPSALRWHRKKECNLQGLANSGSNLSNHRMVSVERLKEREDVYCLQVEKYHNFALSAGVFVHNCGMAAIRLSLGAEHLPDNLKPVRKAIERAVPVGFGEHRDPVATGSQLKSMKPELDRILALHPDVQKHNKKKQGSRSLTEKWARQLGTLGGGNHFIEVCLDESDNIWVMLHSGSRGIGNAIGNYFIRLAKKDMEGQIRNLPHKDLAYLEEGTRHFKDYIDAVWWCQHYALENRRLMVKRILTALEAELPAFEVVDKVIECHHNYVAREEHFGEELFVTRKGAIRAGVGEMGIIPGSMGTNSYIVKGLGNTEALLSCSHGAGRAMSRTEAKKRFTVKDLEEQTAGVECRKDQGIIDEIPSAYKNVDTVIANSSDLVDVVHKLHQVVNIKG